MPRRLRHFFLVTLIAVCPAEIAAAQDAAPDRETITFAGEIEAGQLVEVVSEELGVSVQYRPEDLRQRITLRVREAIPRGQLWSIMTATLESQGLAVVETEQAGLFRILPISQAATQNPRVRLAPGDAPALPDDAPAASFVSAVVELGSLDPAQAATAVQPLLTPNAGVAKPIGGSRLLLIADVRRRVEQAMALLERIDAPLDPAGRFIVDLEHGDAERVAEFAQRTLIAEVTAATKTPITATPSAPAQLIALPGGDRLMVVAPSSREAELRALIAELDVESPVETRRYATEVAPAEELAEAIRTLLSAGQGGESARISTSRLLGAVMVTASEADHARITELLEQIEASPPSQRSQLRAFTIENRDAEELAATLRELLAAGLEDAGQTSGNPVLVDRSGVSRVMSRGEAERALGEGEPATDRAADRPVAAVATETLTLTVDRQTNTMIALGDAAALRELGSLIERLDVRQPQVMIEATLVSLSESDSLDFGVELRGRFQTGQTSVDLSSLFGLASGAALPMGTGFTGVVLNPGDYEVVVRALATTNRGRTLSIPRILVNNNATQTVRAVRREPFTSLNASDTVATTSFGGTQDAGTTLTVTPQIAQGDHLVLDYAVELSAFVGEATSTAGGGVIPPPSQQNTIDGQVTIPDGYTVVLGGIRNSSESEGRSKVPLLGDIPIIGALFGTTGTSNSDSRFYVFVQATILRDPGFRDLRLVGERDLEDAGVSDGMPRLEPLWIE